MISYGKQSIDQKDIDNVVKVLGADFLTQGPLVPKFERLFSEYVTSQYSVAVSSATAALHISCLALDLKKGDILWTSPNSFVASSNCALYCDAEVDFVDINPRTFNIDVDILTHKLKKAKEVDRLPKILIPVHFAGSSCDMERIKELSYEYGFKIIEDASHATGGQYLNYKVGSCHYSDICVFSFHPVKIITTGEGGMITTNDKNIYKKLNLLRSHGITKDTNEFRSEIDSSSSWFYEQHLLGFNYRLTDIQAALGISQLSKIDEFVELRKKIATKYKQELEHLPIQFQQDNQSSAWHLFVIRVKDTGNINRLNLFTFLKENKIFCQIHYIPIPMHPLYQSLGFKMDDFENSKKYYDECISLPIYPSLSSEDHNLVIKKIKEFFHERKE